MKENEGGLFDLLSTPGDQRDRYFCVDRAKIDSSSRREFLGSSDPARLIANGYRERRGKNRGGTEGKGAKSTRGMKHRCHPRHLLSSRA